jgi:hypothetical protein
MKSFERIEHDEGGNKADHNIDNSLQQPIGPLLFSQQRSQLVSIVCTGCGLLQVIMHQARQLRQYFGVLGSLFAELLKKSFGSDLINHPLLKEWLGGVPQIELWV